MSDASNRVHFQNPRMLLVEIEIPNALRFAHIVWITRVCRRHGGGCRLLAGGLTWDATSAYEIVQALGGARAPLQLAFTGPEAALRDLNQLLAHVLANGAGRRLPGELDYLNAAS